MKLFLSALLLIPIMASAQHRQWKVVVDTTGQQEYQWQDGTPLTLQEMYDLHQVDPEQVTDITTYKDVMSFYHLSIVCLGVAIIGPQLLFEFAPAQIQQYPNTTIYLQGIGVGLGILGHVIATRKMRHLLPVAGRNGVGIGIRLE